MSMLIESFLQVQTLVVNKGLLENFSPEWPESSSDISAKYILECDFQC